MAWESLHGHTQCVLSFPDITPLVMSIVFAVLGQRGGCTCKLGGGESLPLPSEFVQHGRFLFEQLFLIVAVCPVLISAGSETIARGWELV